MTRLMLNMHPELCVPPESPHFQILPPIYRKKVYTDKDIKELSNSFPLCNFKNVVKREEFERLLEKVLPAGLNVIIACLYQAYAIGLGKENVRWGDKEPRHWQFIYALRNWYPESQYLHLVRDPRDTITSLIENARRGKIITQHSYIFTSKWIPAHIVIAWNWDYAFKKTVQQGKILGKGRYRLIKYEDLVSDPSQKLSSVCDFLGISNLFLKDMLAFQKDAKDHLIERQIRKGDSEKEVKLHSATLENVNTSRIGNFKNTLTQQQCQDIEFICRDSMSELGYGIETKAAASLIRVLYLHLLCGLLTFSWILLRLRRKFKGQL
jgi:hypothetical protein